MRRLVLYLLVFGAAQSQTLIISGVDIARAAVHLGQQ